MWGVAAKWWHHRAVDQLQTMKVFVRVAQRAGFAAAARDLSMSPAAVTKHVAALESRIRARLFDRTTRSVSLTEAGRAYLERCLECLQAFEDAEDSVNRAGDKPVGRLRVTAPVDFGPGIMTIAAMPAAAARRPRFGCSAAWGPIPNAIPTLAIPWSAALSTSAT